MHEPTSGANPLNDREGRILQALAEGRSIEQVAQRVNMDVSAVLANHRRILRMLHARTTLEAVLTALRSGWIKPPPAYSG